ncbi:MAG: DUF1974 domain-containing protein, partial [Candidatus Nitrotoga sp.]
IQRAIRNFDTVLLGHISQSLSNAVHACLFGLTGGRGFSVPAGKETQRYYQQLTRCSAAFALAADVSMLVLGGKLKRCESISARLGDVLSQLYLSSATLKRFEDDGRPAEDLPLLHWAIQDSLFRIQEAFDGVLQNFPSRLSALILRALIFPRGKYLTPPSDKLGHQVSVLMQQPGAARDRLTAGMYLSVDEHDAVGALEAALHSTLKCEPLQAKVDAAHKAGHVTAVGELMRIAEAHHKGYINAEEARLLERDLTLQRKAIMVDDFAPEQLMAASNII